MCRSWSGTQAPIGRDARQAGGARAGLVTLGIAVLRSWSIRQATVALSSGEAEFHSASKAAAEMLGMRSMMGDLGWKASRLNLHVDARVARYRTDSTIVVRKVGRKWSPADVLTKVLSFSEMLGKLAEWGEFFRHDRTVMPRGGVDRA